MNYYGRRRYRNYARSSRAYRRRTGASSSSLRRASGNYRAALQQRDQSSVNLSIPSTLSVTNKDITVNDGFRPDMQQSVTITSGGIAAINVWDLMRKSTFYQSYSNMYDQVKIDRIRIKLTPSSFVQSNNTNYNAYTVVTAWDRTGLSDEQLVWNTAAMGLDDGPGSLVIGRENATGYGLYINMSADDISTYSSAVTKPVNAGSNSSIIRTIYPRTSQEKGFYVNCADIDKWYEGVGNDNNWYGIKNARAVDATTITYNDGNTNKYIPLYKTMDIVDSNAVHKNPCFIGESSVIAWKPTLLIGILNKTVSVTTGDQTQDQTPRMNFYVEADIGVSFRGLRKAPIV